MTFFCKSRSRASFFILSNVADEVILFGLTIDCCVLSTAQELNWRGYKVHILEDAVDTYSGKQKEKKMILKNVPLSNWADAIKFSTE